MQNEIIRQFNISSELNLVIKNDGVCDCFSIVPDCDYFCDERCETIITQW